MASIKIFDIVLNGIDAERFCDMDVPTKIEYIQKTSMVKDEARIRKFLELPPKQFIVGCCGFVQPIKEEADIIEPETNLEDADKPEGIPEEIAESPESIDDGQTGEPAHSGKQRRPKRG